MHNGDNIRKIDKDKAVDIIYEGETGLQERIDSFLISKFPDYSRSYFQKLIAEGFVVVGDRRVSKSYILKNGDRVSVTFPGPKKMAIKPQDVSFEIVDKQEDFLIINKPAGLTVHHTKEASSKPTLVSGLLYRFKEFEGFSDDDRPGIVHRLDRFTSGLLVVARNEKAQIEFSRMFKERLISKTYLAVVKGHPDPEGEIDFPVGRHPVERTKMSHVSYAGRPALTKFKVVQYYKKGQMSPECALVEVTLVTGRTHQIRVHFAALGHGLLGDDVYGFRSKLIKRQALHAWKLSFDFKGKHYSYTCPVPEDFEKLINFLTPCNSLL